MSATENEASLLAAEGAVTAWAEGATILVESGDDGRQGSGPTLAAALRDLRDGRGEARDCGVCGGSGGGPDRGTRCRGCGGTGMEARGGE